MGGVIGFADSPDSIWLVANWIYRRLWADVAAIVGNDAGVLGRIKCALVFQCLSLDKLDAPVASRIVGALKTVASAAVNDEMVAGLTWKDGLDEKSRIMYKEAMDELLQLLERYEKHVRLGGTP